MRGAVLHEIIEAADLLDLPDNAKDQFKRLVRRMGVAHGVGGMSHAEQVAFAQQLLDARVSRPTIRDRLMARFEISRSQAYAVIKNNLDRPEY